MALKSNFSPPSSLSPQPNIHDIHVAILHGAQSAGHSDIRRPAPNDPVLSP